jgi:hypothetical protein
MQASGLTLQTPGPPQSPTFFWQNSFSWHEALLMHELPIG